ncbi:uncharacterized protein LOC119832209 [Zerene cesonia]|uniref:uncharacterized protein LOC119832209 n=1 Tax=Zerene cesonia TaxID=33412 RepID=UPI0018E55039|nr:uncharacterized protein LOC119832209 [Zerene cesonia]
MNKSFHPLRNYIRIFRGRSFSNKVENVNENAPIKFTTSGAAKASIRPILAKPRNMPWYQPFSVVGSVAVFLIYFCVFREESDIDSEFEKTLYDRIKGLEKRQLLISYRFNKENGRSVVEIEQRLKEIEEEEAKLVA